jgi:hypothetical protein
MGWVVDRQFRLCQLCGGKIQIDTLSSPGPAEDSPAILTEVELHIGSCFPKPSEEVVADNSNVPAAAPAPAPATPAKA